MSFLGGPAGAIGSLLFGGIGQLLGLGKSTQQRAAARPTTRDTAREEVERNDELRRRKGAAADMVTGTGGAEAAGSNIGRLVVGS
ncbi:MAG: hypothetical protein B7Y88_13830 [Sphingomonadales bacterium 32-64-17]|nr:MAG: hypothetical protein B7Y88_13830 [Sphingomonadales bacterium 32-64-17]